MKNNYIIKGQSIDCLFYCFITILSSLLKNIRRCVIVIPRGDGVKKLIYLFLVSVFIFVSCGTYSNSNMNSVPQSSSRTVVFSSQPVSSEPAPSSSEVFEPEIQYYTKRTSSDGKYSVCTTGGYEKDYYIKNNESGEMIEIGRFWGTDVSFISDTQFLLGYGIWSVYDIDGQCVYQLSDYFPMGLTEDGKDIIVFSVYCRDDGSKLILFTDRNEIVKPEKTVNSGTFNEPHLYSIAVMSSENVIEKIINTGKHVESSKSLYTAPTMKLSDDNTLYMYTEYWSDENIPIGYEITVNLSTGESNIVDYRPDVVE